MTIISEARDAINTRFITEWEVLNPFTVDGRTFTAGLALDNESFSPTLDIPWVRLTIRNIGGGQETLGRPSNRRYERLGSIIVQVFTPANTGLLISDTLTREVQRIFESESFDGVDVNNSVIREIGVDGEWLLVNVETEFLYYEIK